VGVAEVVDVEQLRGERVAAVVTLAAIGVDVHTHASNVAALPGGAH
jgi:hypothetical protein